MKDTKVLLFLAQGFEDLEAVAIIDVCGWTEYREEIPTVRVTTTGFHEEVRGRFGLVIHPDVLVDRIDPEDYSALALPGGFHSHGYSEAYDPHIHQLARAIHAKGGTIATMCVGVLPVAQAGLLDGKKATTYPLSRTRDNAAYLRKFGCESTEGPIEVCDRIISCAGPAQSIEVGLLLLENIIGPETAREVKRYMTYERRKDEPRDSNRQNS